MYKFLQILKRDFLNMLFNPMWVFYDTVFPLMLILILGFLNSGAYGNEVSSYDYYGVAMILYIILNTATLSANGFMEERIKQGNMRLIYSPLPKSYIYLSKILATSAFASLCHISVMILLELFMKVNYGGKNIIFIIIILIFAEIFASVIGVLFCCIFKSENIANQILSIVINIWALLGGLFFKVDSMGKALEKLSYISPVKWMMISIFKIIYDRNFSDYMVTIGILMISSIIAGALCEKFYKPEEYV